MCWDCERIPTRFIRKQMSSFLSAHLAFLWMVWSSARTPPLSRTMTRLSTDSKTASPNWPTPSTTTTASPHRRRSCSIQRQVWWMTSWVSSTSQKSRSSNNSWCRFENTTADLERFSTFSFKGWIVSSVFERIQAEFCGERGDWAESWVKMDKPHWLTDPSFLI